MATINGCQSRSRTNLTTAAKVVVSGFTEQMHTTVFAIKDTMIHVHRKLRRTHQDIVNLCKNGQKRKDITCALSDKSVLRDCKLKDRMDIQEIYFGITMMMISLVLGGITGNIWHNLGCFPQLTVSYALLIIFSLLYQFYHQFKMVPVDPTDILHRSRLYLKLVLIGFSLGRLCSYSLVMTAPRILCPLVLAFLIDTKIKFFPPIFRGNRMEFFMVLAVFVTALDWLLLFMLRQMSIQTFFASIFLNAVKLMLVIGHFQMLYYGYSTLVERERKAAAEQSARPPSSHGCCGGSKPVDPCQPVEQKPEKFDLFKWNSDAHFLYLLVAVISDILIAIFQ